MFIKNIKSLILLVLAIAVFVTPVCAQEYEISDELISYGQEVYSGARSFFNGRSFSGYCGTYVRCQLRAMGIFDGKFDFRGNGNQWYSNFEDVQRTSGGYYVYRESGSDCLYKLTEKYGNDLKNIVISFPVQAGYSARYPGAGHAFIIYELKDGVAYYSESFGYGKYREGQIIAEDIESLMERYERRHGSANGAVLLSEYDLEAERSDELLIQEVKETIEILSDINFIVAEFAGISQSRVTV